MLRTRVLAGRSVTKSGGGSMPAVIPTHRHVGARHSLTRRTAHRPVAASAEKSWARAAAGEVGSNDAQCSLPRTLVAAALAAGLSAMALCAPRTALALPPGKAAVSSEQLRSIVEEDFTQRRYMVTGDMTFDVYAEDAHFVDSNNDFGRPGPRKWADSLKGFLDSNRSKMALTGPVVLDEQARTITLPWKQVNFFKLPGSPHTSLFTGRTVLKLDPKDNIIVEHSEIWDDKPGDVLKGLKFFDKDYVPPGF